jgi:hypothetical protein
MKTTQHFAIVSMSVAAVCVSSVALAQTAGTRSQLAVGGGTAATTQNQAAPAPAAAPEPAPAAAQEPGPAPMQYQAAPPPAQQENAAPATAAEVGGTDHSQVVRHIGVGFLGTRGMLFSDNADPANNGEILAPVIGIRYWLAPNLGIDAGLGFAMGSGSSDPADAGSVDINEPTVIMLHGGLPIALAEAKHFSFQIVPELNLGYASASSDAGDYSAMHVDLGARAGAEIQFGFIDIPQLSLQAGVGLRIAHDSLKSDLAGPGGEATYSMTRIGTLTGPNPWNIFTSSISALYYL